MHVIEKKKIRGKGTWHIHKCTIFVDLFSVPYPHSLVSVFFPPFLTSLFSLLSPSAIYLDTHSIEFRKLLKHNIQSDKFESFGNPITFETHKIQMALYFIVCFVSFFKFLAVPFDNTRHVCIGCVG